MRKTILGVVLAAAMVVPMYGQDTEKIIVPKSLLTQEQLQKANGNSGSDLRENVSKWAGVGKEVGEAVNSSMKAITEQTNNFANTKAGRITIFLLVWKLFGDQLIHVGSGFLFLFIFLTIWIWSYRRMCVDRSIKVGKDMYEKILYRDSYKGGDVTPRGMHFLALGILVVIFLITVFSY